MRRLLALGLAGALAACGRGGDSRAAAGDSSGMHMGMDSMQMEGRGMGGGMGGMHDMMGMTSSMRAHMDSMMRLPPQRMRAMIAGHDRMMSQMMDGMSADMRRMSMQADPAWSALTDSLKRDLAELPGLEGKALDARMKAHAERVRRLLATHEGMMQGMEKR
ncbi:MAG: hypothetical protein ACREOF_10170 [Gemmatimonadales bacterium]